MDQTTVTLAAALGAVAAIFIVWGLHRLRQRFDNKEPEIWTEVADRAMHMAEQDALEKDQAAKAAAAAAKDAHDKIAAFKARISAPAV